MRIDSRFRRPTIDLLICFRSRATEESIDQKLAHSDVKVTVMQFMKAKTFASLVIFFVGLCAAQSTLADTIGISGQMQTFGDGSQAILVTNVVQGSQSDILGVRPGDLLLALNGRLPQNHADFKTLLDSRNGFVELKIHRNGTNLALSAWLNQNQGAPGPFLAQPRFKFPNPLDIEVSTRRAGDGERRVRVDKVDAGGLGAIFGLQRHDYIFSVNGRPVNTVDDYVGELQRARGQIVLQVTDVLKRRNRTVTIRPQAP